MLSKKDAYLVLGYACNHACKCCPCSKEQHKNQFISFNKLKKYIDRMKESGITGVTISGGEPTIHPDFFSVIAYLFEKDISVHILTNGDKFYDRLFCNGFLDTIMGNPISITTTFHHYIPEEHEKQNRSHGSFHRTLKGLQYLDRQGVNISIKHCITQSNYSTLESFLRFFTEELSDNIEFQLWGLDFSGLTGFEARSAYISYTEIKQPLENALNWFEGHNTNRKQILTINNIPLCSCDCKFWPYFSLPNDHRFFNFTEDDISEIDKNYGPISTFCHNCPVRYFCRGTYISAFEFFGDDIVAPPECAIKYQNYVPEYNFFTKDNISYLFFSPFNEFKLTKMGLVIYNRLSGGEVCLRLSAMEMDKFFLSFTTGVNEDKALNLLNSIDSIINAQEYLKDLMYCGVLE